MKKTLAALLMLFHGFIGTAQVVPSKMAKPDSGKSVSVQDNNNPFGKPDDPADSLYRHLPDAKKDQPLYIVNSNIITGVSHINPNDITSINILTGAEIPANLVNLSRFGIVFITLRKDAKIKTSTFSEIKKEFNIGGKAKFAVDGYFVDDESLLIATHDINEINLTWKKLSEGPPDVIINIWTLAPDARKGFIYKPNPNDKPGTIRIRRIDI